MTRVSDNALRVWFSFFFNPNSTLRFGGDHAEMEITEDGRAALDELIAIGAVKDVEPGDQWPGREHYGSTGIDLRPMLQKRGLNLWEDSGLVLFRKKADQ